MSPDKRHPDPARRPGGSPAGHDPSSGFPPQPASNSASGAAPSHGDSSVVGEIPGDIRLGESTVTTEINELQEALRAAESEILRGQAELENYRKRARRELEEERRYAFLPLMRDLLPVMDNLQRALAHGVQNGSESDPLLAGVRMVIQELTGTLEKHHCHRVEAAGAPFDPNYHEALGQQPSSEHPAGHVATVVTEGYRLHDRVIRPSQVLVSTGSPGK